MPDYSIASNALKQIAELLSNVPTHVTQTIDAYNLYISHLGRSGHFSNGFVGNSVKRAVTLVEVWL